MWPISKRLQVSNVKSFVLVQSNVIKHVSIKLARVQDFEGKEKNTEFSGNTPCATFEVLTRSLLF